MSERENKAAGLLIALIFLVVAAIEISRALFPLLFLGFIGSIIYSVFNWRNNDDLTFPGLLLIFFLIGSIATYFVGYTFGESPFGLAFLNTGNTLMLAEEIKTNSTNLAIDVVENASKSLCDSAPNSSFQCEETTENAFDVLKIGVQ
jgi:hypothetical protein